MAVVILKKRKRDNMRYSYHLGSVVPDLVQLDLAKWPPPPPPLWLAVIFDQGLSARQALA